MVVMGAILILALINLIFLYGDINELENRNKILENALKSATDYSVEIEAFEDKDREDGWMMQPLNAWDNFPVKNLRASGFLLARDERLDSGSRLLEFQAEWKEIWREFIPVYAGLANLFLENELNIKLNDGEGRVTLIYRNSENGEILFSDSVKKGFVNRLESTSADRIFYNRNCPEEAGDRSQNAGPEGENLYTYQIDTLNPEISQELDVNLFSGVEEKTDRSLPENIKLKGYIRGEERSYFLLEKDRRKKFISTDDDDKVLNIEKNEGRYLLESKRGKFYIERSDLYEIK